MFSDIIRRRLIQARALQASVLSDRSIKPGTYEFAAPFAVGNELSAILREIDDGVTKPLEVADEDTLRIARMFAPV